MRRQEIGISLGIALMLSNSYASERLPTSPVWPTRADCQQLWAAFNQIRRSAWDTVNVCMSGPAHIGPGYEVSTSGSCALVPGVRAWPQCVDEEQYACQMAEKANEESRICYQRADQRAAQEEKSSSPTGVSRTAAAQKSAATALKATNVLYDLAKKFDKARGLLTNPSKFLLDALSGPSRATLSEFLDGGGNLRPERYEDTNELYRYIKNLTDTPDAATSNPIIRQIQKETLRGIVQHFGMVLALMDQAGRDIENFNAWSGEASVRVPGQASRIAVSPAAPDCSLLKDPARSRQFMQENQAGWLALVGKCNN